MAFVRKLLADKSAAVAIVLIVVQALVLIGFLQSHASVSNFASRAIEIATDICTDSGLVAMAEGEHDKDCCAERHCVILCAQAASSVLASDLTAGSGILTGLRQCRAVSNMADMDANIEPRGMLGSIGARDPPMELRMGTLRLL